MNAYEVFASVYDELMDNIPYDDWCAYIIQVLQKYRVTDGLVCEMGCGLRSQMIKRLKQGMNPYSISCRT